MKLKYKKIILLTTLSTMGIGLLTLSISQSKPKADEQKKITSGIVAEAEENDQSNEDIDVSTMAKMDLAMDNLEEAVATPIPTVAPTPIPTPTPFPVYSLEEMEGMDAFMEVFFNAKASIDVEKLKSIYHDPSKVETREQLQRMVQYIEDYKNIKTYSKKSIEEGTYIVYAYHEIKFSSINTLAPGLSKFYVITDENGNFKIFSYSNMTPEVKEYFNARNDDEDVLELIRTTNEKGEEAKNKDEDLMIYWNGLDELAQSNGSQSTPDEQSQTAESGN
jgi:hypothetical protein